MKLSELISKIIVRTTRNPKICLLDKYEYVIGTLVVTDDDWNLKSVLPIDIFKTTVVEITFYPELELIDVMIDEVLRSDRD